MKTYTEQEAIALHRKAVLLRRAQFQGCNLFVGQRVCVDYLECKGMTPFRGIIIDMAVKQGHDWYGVFVVMNDKGETREFFPQHLSILWGKDEGTIESVHEAFRKNDPSMRTASYLNDVLTRVEQSMDKRS